MRPFSRVRFLLEGERRDEDILKHGILWKQMIILKYESDVRVAISRQFRLRERKGIGVVNLNLSSRGFF